MSYTYEEKIANGLQVTNRSNSIPVGAHLQGIEITDLNQGRSGLPVLGRNPRYDVLDLSVGNSGSMSDRPWFEDVGSKFDPGVSISGSVAFITFPEGNVGQAISFKIQSADYGFGKEYYDTVPYYDLTKYNALAYVNESGPTGMFPVVGSFPSYDSALQLNGIVEPLEIRRKMLGQSLFLPNERQPGAISGDFSNDDNPAFMFDVRERAQRAAFFEDVATKGISSYGSEQDQAAAMLEAEYISDFSPAAFYFVDRGQVDIMISDSEIVDLMLYMDPTIDEGALGSTFIDQAVGWDSISRDRINSIVYRGLMRG